MRSPSPRTNSPCSCPTTSTSGRAGSRRSPGTTAFVHTTCPICGEAARRDTDTMDTFVDSSWYFIRYCSAGDELRPFEPEEVERWMPADQYTGGVEHAILHLLYCRFFTKVLYDIGLVSFIEPFPRLMNQGQVIYGGASMSKSKGNIVEPMPLVERWGADTMRLMMLFAGPFEDDIDWKLIEPKDDRRPGVNTWLGRVFAAVCDAAERDAAGAGGAASPHASNDRGRDRRPRAVPLQRRDLEAAGADERAAVDAGRGRRGPRGGDVARRCCSRRWPRSSPRSSGARCSATRQRAHGRPGRPSTRSSRAWSR